MPTRTYMRAQLGQHDLPPNPFLRSVRPDDVSALAQLLFDAYLGTVDYAEENVQQAAEEIRKTTEGEYGAFDPMASKVFDRHGLLLSATLITRIDSVPFIAFSFTAPEHKNKGYARACMTAALQELSAMGEREVRLVVTLANAPAVHLYKALGFAAESDA